jgi:hypothetical protein
MRALVLVLATSLWASGVAAQQTATVRVTAQLTIPDFLWLTAETETVVGEVDGELIRQVRLHVKANRGWTLVVSCGTEGEGGEPAARWRTGEAGGALLPCTGDQAAADGVRGNDSLVVLEYVVPAGVTPPTYQVVAR